MSQEERRIVIPSPPYNQQYEEVSFILHTSRVRREYAYLIHIHRMER
jgi:hypothetical protein